MAAAFGEKLKSIYARWAVFIDMAGRFLAAAASFLWIRYAVGSEGLFSSVPVLLLAALVTSMIGNGASAVFAFFLTVIQALSVSPETGALTAAVLILLYILFLRFVPEDSVSALLMPPAMFFGLPVIVPLILGLKRRPVSVLGAASGVVWFYLCAAVREAAPGLSKLEASDYTGRLGVLRDSLLLPEIFVCVTAAAGTVLIVSIIRRLEISCGFSLAIIAGGVVWMLIILLGNSLAGSRFDPASMAVGTAASVIVTLILQLLFLPLDYRRSRQLRFEDDDYYYYVTAVPKIMTELDDAEDLEFPDFEQFPAAGAALKPEIDHDELERRLENSLEDL